MGFKPGHKRVGGRKPGTPNKNSLDLHAKCEAKGIDPFEKLLEYLEFPGEPNIRLQAIKEICKYLYPQRKAIEHSGEIANPYLKMPIEDLEKEVKARLKKK